MPARPVPPPPAGGIKRWGFARGNMTHGSKSKREHGSIGARSAPPRRRRRRPAAVRPCMPLALGSRPRVQASRWVQALLPAATVLACGFRVTGDPILDSKA